MGLVPKEMRSKPKPPEPNWPTLRQFIGMQLTTARMRAPETTGERLIMRTEHSHLFGYVQKGHESSSQQLSQIIKWMRERWEPLSEDAHQEYERRLAENKELALYICDVMSILIQNGETG